MLVTLQRIVETVNKSPDFNLALKAMVSQVREALETDSCSVFLADDESQQFVMAASDGLSTHKNAMLTSSSIMINERVSNLSFIKVSFKTYVILL